MPLGFGLVIGELGSRCHLCRIQLERERNRKERGEEGRRAKHRIERGR